MFERAATERETPATRPARHGVSTAETGTTADVDAGRHAHSRPIVGRVVVSDRKAEIGRGQRRRRKVNHINHDAVDAARIAGVVGESRHLVRR